MARFDAYTVGTPVIVVPKGSSGRAYPEKLSAASNYIDEHINTKLKQDADRARPSCADDADLRPPGPPGYCRPAPA